MTARKTPAERLDAAEERVRAAAWEASIGPSAPRAKRRRVDIPRLRKALAAYDAALYAVRTEGSR